MSWFPQSEYHEYPMPIGGAMTNAGFVTFNLRDTAMFYLENLPIGYSGKCYKTDVGKWAVSFRKVNR